MGYVYYGNYATYFEVARVEALRSLGINYNEMEDKGVMLPVLSYSTKFFKPAFWNLLWVDPFWGRENPREHGRYTSVSKTGQRCSICHDFASLSLINVDFEERFGIPRLLLSMLVPCRIASRYSEKNPLFFSL